MIFSAPPRLCGSAFNLCASAFICGKKPETTIIHRLLNCLKNHQTLAALKSQPLPYSQWRRFRDLPCVQHLTAVEMAHLRLLTRLLLAQKHFTGAQGLVLDEEMKQLIAVQACVPILKLGLDYYRDFVEIIVYPAPFYVEHEEYDESGVVHRQRRLLSGESWQRGPVVLSWQDIEAERNTQAPGRNVVIHEFAHKIDMLNSAADGFPPLSRSQGAQEWSRVFNRAYEHLQSRLDQHHHSCIDPYAATSPAEFYAVVTEYFFTAPDQLHQCSPHVYKELKNFYHQDPRTTNDR